VMEVVEVIKITVVIDHGRAIDVGWTFIAEIRGTSCRRSR
jgi:hypothetical protein